jgi:hypothetical protein
MDDSKRFDEWTQIECNECTRWWDSSCDGVKKGQKRPCNAFLATRKVSIPKQIEKLENDTKFLKRSVLLLSIYSLVQSISIVIHYFG